MNRPLPVMAALALLLLTGLTYLPALRNGFVWDDDLHLTHNPAVTSVGGLRTIWTSCVLPVYYPLTFTAFWSMYQLWGANPWPYHAIALAFHTANAVLLFFVLQRLKIRAAWMVAAVWAIHPVNVESVAWVTELKNTLSGVFFFLTLLCHLKSEGIRAAVPGGNKSPAPGDQRSDTQPGWYALSLLCYIAALLSKSSTVVLPVVLLLCAWWQRRRLTRTDVVRSLLFFALSLLAAFVAIATAAKERLLQGSTRGWSLAWPERLIVAGKNVWFYAFKILWPQDLIFIYPRWTHDDLVLREWLPLLGAVLVGVVLWRWRQTNWGRAGLFGISYFVVALVPILGFFDQYFFLYSFVADHFQYLASIGIIALVVGLLDVAVKARVVRTALATGAVSILCVLTWRQCHVFRDLETLWRDTLAKNSQAAIAYNNLGTLLNSQQRYEEALGYLQEALRLRPGTWEPHNNLGIALTELGRYDAALHHCQEALRIRPEYGASHYRLGVVYARMKRLADAERHYLLAIRYDPHMPEAYFDLGLVREGQGRRTLAIKAYRDAVRLKPDYAFAHNNLANLLAEESQLDEAIQHYQQAVAADPKLEAAQHNLAILLRRTGDLNGAIQHLRIAVELEPARANTRLDLGQALMAAGRYGEAIETFRQGLETQPENVGLENALAWLLATCPEAQRRDGAQAVRISERLVEVTDRKRPEVLDTLAAAYAEAGRFDDAVRTAKEALTLAQARADSNVAAAIDGHLRLYKLHQAFRSPNS